MHGTYLVTMRFWQLISSVNAYVNTVLLHARTKVVRGLASHAPAVVVDGALVVEGAMLVVSAAVVAVQGAAPPVSMSVSVCVLM